MDSVTSPIGPNHRDGCTGESYRLSGEGYNRVRICACGAEDHDPDPGVIPGSRWRHRVLDELAVVDVIDDGVVAFRLPDGQQRYLYVSEFLGRYRQEELKP